MTLPNVWLIVVMSNCVGGIILSFLWLWMKDKADERYQIRKDAPGKMCFDAFITKEMHEQKDKKLEESIEHLRNDLKCMEQRLERKIDMVIELFRQK